MNTRHGYHTTPASRSMPPAQYPFPSQPQAPAPMIVETPRIHRRARYRGHLLLELSIARRLTLGFFIAALLAASVTGIIGLLRVQTLDKQSSFYRNVLQVNTKLNTGANFLQLMNAEVHVMLDAAAQPHPSQETLKTDQQALENLTNQYNSILTDYITHDLLNKHADQAALLNEAGHADQVARQITLAGSALRSWQVYRTAQTQVISDISSGNLGTSQHLEQVHGEPTHADALSALNSLIQFNGRLASYVQGAAQVETQSQLLTTIIGSVLAFIAIGLVGWFISGTLVRRLQHLLSVTRAVENGELSARAAIIGRDEIADVSESVNAMLEAIARLFEETTRQRDALTNAAEHLFSDMRIVSAGDLRVNAPVSNDPIGMLANAFNFTVSRFRRFIMRTQTSVEQLDVLSRQTLKHSESMLQAFNRLSSIASAMPGSTWQGDPKLFKTGHLAEPRMLKEKEMLQEASRLGTDFANEVNALARKLGTLANEIRLGIVSFQVEGVVPEHINKAPDASLPPTGIRSQPLAPGRHTKIN